MSRYLKLEGNFCVPFTSAIVNSLDSIFVVTQEYNSGGYVYTKSNEKITIEILSDEDFKQPDPIYVQLEAQVSSANKNWLDYYRKCEDLKKQVAELTKQLDTIRGTVNPETSA